MGNGVKSAVSTISFNTEEFLKMQLDKTGAFYFYVPHNPELHECDETKKAHFHVYLWNKGKPIDLENLAEMFVQNLLGEDLPRRCLPWRKSEFGDAYLYFIHSPSYLAAKGLYRQFSYTLDDVITNDRDFLLSQIGLINVDKYCTANYLANMEQAYNLGIRDFGHYITTYKVPIQQYAVTRTCWRDYCHYRSMLERAPQYRSDTEWASFFTDRNEGRMVYESKHIRRKPHGST